MALDRIDSSTDLSQKWMRWILQLTLNIDPE
jgi:hypothetical protein